MSKPLKLKMEFETNNPCVRSFNRIVCGWGMRKTPYDEKEITKDRQPLYGLIHHLHSFYQYL